MNIDLMGSFTPDDATIAHEMQVIIEAKYTPAQREQLARGTAAQKKELTDFYKTMTTLKASVVADRDLLKDTIAYEQAVALSATTALDPKAVDDSGALLYPTFKDMTGVTQPNPAIEADTASRKQAAATIKTATTAVKTLVKKRLAAQHKAVV